MLMTEGFQNREIANQIEISSHTVRAHLYNVFENIDADWPMSNLYLLWSACTRRLIMENSYQGHKRAPKPSGSYP